MALELTNQSHSEINYLERTTLIRDIYRALLNNGRTYAAFEKEQILPLIQTLQSRNEILDPMSGYGGLMTSCIQSQLQIKTFNIEFNPPSFFWQILTNPQYNNIITNFVMRVYELRNKFPKSTIRAIASDTWFPKESQRLIKIIWDLCHQITGEMGFDNNDVEIIPLTFLLPFIGRLSACVQGNVVTHVKRGGICVYHGWENDFLIYIEVLLNKLNKIRNYNNQCEHRTILADSKTIKLPECHFSAMITSPPYPNSRDYSTMFAPENAFLEWLVEEKFISQTNQNKKFRLIGSPKVSEKDGYVKKTIDDIQSNSAKKFLRNLKNYKGTKKSENDNRTYYIPYFCNYFYELEKAYENIAPSLATNFEGYIIVVNNTAKKTVVPVAESVIDIWKRLGFKARKITKMTRELSHIGGINNEVKGLTARHMEYTIKVWRS